MEIHWLKCVGLIALMDYASIILGKTCKEYWEKLVTRIMGPFWCASMRTLLFHY